MKINFVSPPHNYSTCMHVAFAVQLVMMAWNARPIATGLKSIQNSLHANLFHNNWRVIIEVIDRRDQGNVLQLQRAIYAFDDRVAAPGDTRDGLVASEALGHSVATDEAIGYLASFIFSERTFWWK